MHCFGKTRERDPPRKRETVKTVNEAFESFVHLEPNLATRGTGCDVSLECCRSSRESRRRWHVGRSDWKWTQICQRYKCQPEHFHRGGSVVGIRCDQTTRGPVPRPYLLRGHVNDINIIHCEELIAMSHAAHHDTIVIVHQLVDLLDHMRRVFLCGGVRA